jgi:methionyl-tRNA synthetase
VRWWLLREVPRVGDADFTVARLAARYERDLANDLGNLVNRVVSMVHRYRGGTPSRYQVDEGDPLVAVWREAPGRVDAALADFDFAWRRRPCGAWWRRPTGTWRRPDRGSSCGATR